MDPGLFLRKVLRLATSPAIRISEHADRGYSTIFILIALVASLKYFLLELERLQFLCGPFLVWELVRSIFSILKDQGWTL